MTDTKHKFDSMPDNSGGMDRKETIQTKSRLKVKFSIFMATLIAMVSSASASVNWTELTELLEGVVTIFPSIANMVGEIIPVLFYLIVVAFVMRFFNSIIHMIEGVTNIFK